MNKTLAILGGTPMINKNDAKFIWPKITHEIENVLKKQLYKSISIYNRSGIFKEFEDNFAKFHGVKYALLSNSGTNAIFSMFEGINILPGDEIICPSYTFFATISPILYTGAIPVFCDCFDDGNINTKEIESKITKKTKAVIVTHMWGIPCDMDKISEICKQNNLVLFEDCSHAHGASFHEKKIGSFGDASAWSLQGQKIITGGEGGIMLTKHKDIFDRALLQGHYNKRCKNEISNDSPLYKYSLTGLGLKFRAHPLAIAIANEQLKKIDKFIEQKQKFVNLIEKELNKYKFLKLPKYIDKQPSWYAYIFQFDINYSNGVSVDTFVKALLFEGLIEVDRPGSTRPIHNLPLFKDPHKIMPRLYNKTINQTGKFDNALKFYENAVKIPVWAYPEDRDIMKSYIEGFKKVCDLIVRQPNLLLTVQNERNKL